MKTALVLFVVVLSVIVALNEACTPGSTRKPTERNSTKTRRPKPYRNRRYRIFSFAIVTHKPPVKKLCTLPNVCLENCGQDRYLLGRYDCTGRSLCCAPY